MNNLPVVRSPWRIVILLLGFTFLYAPMLMLVIYSFNSSKLVTVWAGWSTRWYGELLRDDAMMSAVGLSLTIAACAATAAAILGTIAAVVLVRFGRFRGIKWFCLHDHRTAGNARCHHGFVAVVVIRRACSCYWLACGPRYAHHLAGACHFLYGLCGSRYFVASAGTGSLDRRSRDGSRCDAAESVFVITLPMIMTAIISGWLLAFTLSLDDLVIASFVSGPGATTLPMLVSFQRADGGESGNQRPGNIDPRRGRNCRIYRLVSDGARRKTADTRHPACKTWLKTLKFANLAT